MHVCRVVLAGLEYLAMVGGGGMPMGRLVALVLGVGAVSVASGGGTALFTLSVQRWEQHSGGERQRCVGVGHLLHEEGVCRGVEFSTITYVKGFIMHRIFSFSDCIE
eukprot:12616850-Ditylum_brightwellii.AAC.1